MTAAGFAGTTMAVLPGAVWTKACVALKSELGEGAFGSWVAQAAVRESQGGSLVLVTQTGIARDWIRRNAWRRISELWAQHDPQGRALELKSRFELDESEKASGAPDAGQPQALSQTVPAPAAPGHAAAPAVEGKGGDKAVARPHGLQDRFTLDSFV